ncbi:MAG: serpin family protein, partial [candidate division Zixibacteria bacterium]|nr:serpin family protein [candidate division Zixibacteria bacterium]
LLESANKFGLNLFREIAANTAATENIFISPLSVSYAFGICYNGAKGDTREAIGSTLQMAGMSVEEMNEAYRDVTKILMQTDPLVEFKVANSFWSRLGKAIQPDFIEMSRTYFDARVEEIDFQAPWAADTINAWVDRSTNGKIKKMVDPPINAAAILMNAIYFKGDWMFPFDTANTHDYTFNLADGSETECQMMWLTEEEHAVQVDENTIAPDTNATFFNNDYLKAISLPYGRGDYRMTILMPNLWANPDGTVDDIIDRFTWENWESWLEGFHPVGFTAGLPKFKFEYEVSLTQILQTLGMEIAFDPVRADFSNMFVDGVGWIDRVKQKAFVQVDEKGTEAAAVTQVVFIDSMPPGLICDSPFLVVIHEDVSGAILFIGKIADPVWED